MLIVFPAIIQSPVVSGCLLSFEHEDVVFTRLSDAVVYAVVSVSLEFQTRLPTISSGSQPLLFRPRAVSVHLTHAPQRNCVLCLNAKAK